MARPEQADEGAVPFAWGKKRGRGGKELNVQFYASFTYDGVEYSLYDSVYLYKEGEPEPFIGKLIKMWEQPGNRKRVKILWLFRPVEIRNFLGEQEKPLKNEIFLACGQGDGVSDVNPLESIAGKCNVVCTSKDPRNRQPSDEELKLADYIFRRAFDVGSCTISDEIGETIDGVKAEFIFNFDEETRHQRSGMNGSSKNPSPTVDIVPENIRSIEPEIGAEVENSGPLDGENDSSSKKIKLPDASRKRKSSVVTDVTEENMTSKPEIESSRLKSGKSKSSLSTPDVSMQEIESEIGAEVANSGPLDAPNDPSSKKMKLPDASRKQKSSNGTDATEEKMISKLESEFSSLKSGKSKPSQSTSDVSLQKIEPEICAEAVNSGPIGAPNDSSSKKMKLPDASRKQKSGNGTDIIEEKMISKLESEFSSLKSGKSKPSLWTPDVSLQEIEPEIRAEAENSGPIDAPNDPSSKKMKLPDASRKPKSGKGTDATEEKMISKLDSEFSSLKSGKPKQSLSSPHVSLQKIEPEICAEAANSGPIDAPNDSSSKKMKLPHASEKQKSGKGTDITEEKMTSKLESEFSSAKSGKPKPTPDVSSQKRQNFNDEQVPRRPGAETSKWFTSLPWETRIQEAREQGTLLLVENFDLVHTSEEIEDLIYHFFKKQCTARVIEFSMFSSPFHGRALVICKSKGDAEEIVKRLKENVLMLSNGRPLIARMMLNRRPPAESKSGKFYGHYVAEKTRRRPQREEMRNAVSTSHCSQPNTLEFEMAVDWMLLHEKSAGWWRELHEEHEKEVKKLRLDRPAAAKKRV